MENRNNIVTCINRALQDSLQKIATTYRPR